MVDTFPIHSSVVYSVSGNVSQSIFYRRRVIRRRVNAQEMVVELRTSRGISRFSSTVEEGDALEAQPPPSWSHTASSATTFKIPAFWANWTRLMISKKRFSLGCSLIDINPCREECVWTKPSSQHPKRGSSRDMDTVVEGPLPSRRVEGDKIPGYQFRQLLEGCLKRYSVRLQPP